MDNSKGSSMNGVVNYEGHKFNPWECSGWSRSDSVPGGIWYVKVGKSSENRDFTTRQDPIKPGGLWDQIQKAKLELAEAKT